MGGVTLEPRHPFDIIQEYDVRRGYLASRWQAMHAQDPIPSTRLDHLGRKGYEVVDVLWPEVAADYVGTEVWASDIGKDHFRAVLTEVFNPQLNEKLRNYFMSPYTVLFWNITQSGDDNPSLVWHCDAGPSCYLKMLVYLNRTEGATEVLDRPTTDLFKRIGYGYLNFEHRVDDIVDLGDKYRIEAKPERLSPDQGQAVLFEPSQVLHRGIYPKAETRWLMQIGIIPWLKPWDESFDDMYGFVAKNVGFGFPPVTGEA